MKLFHDISVQSQKVQFVHCIVILCLGQCTATICYHSLTSIISLLAEHSTQSLPAGIKVKNERLVIIGIGKNRWCRQTGFLRIERSFLSPSPIYILW